MTYRLTCVGRNDEGTVVYDVTRDGGPIPILFAAPYMVAYAHVIGVIRPDDRWQEEESGIVYCDQSGAEVVESNAWIEDARRVKIEPRAGGPRTEGESNG